MTGLPGFLRAREDEREAHIRRGREICRCTPDGEQYISYHPPGVPMLPECPQFILADVAAKRAIIDLHDQIECVNCVDRGRKPGTSCRTCHHDDEAGHPGRYDGTCATLRALAAIHERHPKYDPGWSSS